MRPETIFVQLPPDLPLFIKNIKPKTPGKDEENTTRMLYKDMWY